MLLVIMYTSTTRTTTEMKRTLPEQPIQLRTIEEIDRDAKLCRFLERCKQLAEYDRLLIDRAKINEIGLREQSIGRCVNALKIFREKTTASNVSNLTNMVPIFAALQSELDSVRDSLKADCSKLYNRYIHSDPRGIQVLAKLATVDSDSGDNKELTSDKIGGLQSPKTQSSKTQSPKRRCVDTWASAEYVPVAEVSPTAASPTAASPTEAKSCGTTDDCLVVEDRHEMRHEMRHETLQRMIAGYNQYVLAAEAFHATCNEPCWDRMFEIMTVDIGRLDKQILKHDPNEDELDLVNWQKFGDLSEHEFGDIRGCDGVNL